MNLTWERWRLAGVLPFSPQQLAGETPALPGSWSDARPMLEVEATHEPPVHGPNARPILAVKAAHERAVAQTFLSRVASQTERTGDWKVAKNPPTGMSALPTGSKAQRSQEVREFSLQLERHDPTPWASGLRQLERQADERRYAKFA